jgi:hypothetical protein
LASGASLEKLALAERSEDASLEMIHRIISFASANRFSPFDVLRHPSTSFDKLRMRIGVRIEVSAWHAEKAAAQTQRQTR